MITDHEAKAIADEIDPKAGGFFRNCLMSAATKGAQLAASKLGKVTEPVAAGTISGAMPGYQCHKKVRALKIHTISLVAIGYEMTFHEPGFTPVTEPDEFCARGLPDPGDYYVVYDDGYRSWSPAKAFEDGYTRI